MTRHKAIVFGATALLFCGMCVMENSTVKARPAEKSPRNTSSVYALAGEFRVVFANLLWMKTEQYHHEYIRRGGDWTKDKELIGLTELITDLDPHFVEAYAAEVYLYANGSRDNRRAERCLRTALVNNPRSFDLHQLAAVFYAGRMHQPKKAIPYAKLALKYADDSFDRQIAVRLLNTVRTMAAEPQGGPADHTGISIPSGPSRRSR